MTDSTQTIRLTPVAGPKPVSDMEEKRNNRTMQAAVKHANATWGRMSLATQFALASGMVLLTASLAIGWWAANRTEASVVRNTAHTTALYMESFVSPISQQLAERDHLSAGAARALEEIFTNTPLGERVVSYKIWKPGGLIVEASDKSMIGKRFAPSANLKAAWSGEISATFNRLGDDEDVNERALGLPLLEVYSPIREAWSGEVIAVAEFYEIALQLEADLVAVRRSVWLAIAGVVLGLGSVLYAIVLSGSRTIERQRRDLDARLIELDDLAGRNRDLRLRIQRAAARAAASTEQTLRRIGADLHDGPAQDLALAALRLDSLRRSMTGSGACTEFNAVRDAVARAMTELRAISRGFSLPDIAERSLSDVVRAAVDAHEIRTGQEVGLHIDCPRPPPADPAVRICIFRFVQEGLANAGRHGHGEGLAVEFGCDAGTLTLVVRDHGPGFDGSATPERQTGLGLTGLRDRVESLGGIFSARSLPQGGAEITMTLETGG